MAQENKEADWSRRNGNKEWYYKDRLKKFSTSRCASRDINAGEIINH